MFIYAILAWLIFGATARASVVDCTVPFQIVVRTPERINAFVHPAQIQNLGPKIRRERNVGTHFDTAERLLREAAAAPDLWEISFKTGAGQEKTGTLVSLEGKAPNDTIRLATGSGVERVAISSVIRRSLCLHPKPLAIPSALNEIPAQSDFALAVGVPYLSHYTSRAGVMGIFGAGNLYQSKGVSNAPAVYLRPLNKSELGQKPDRFLDLGKHHQPRLLFSTKLFDRDDYYLNVDMDDHGARTQESTPFDDQKGIRELLWPLGGNSSQRVSVEMMAYGPVPVDDLVAVMLPVGQKKRYLRDLHRAGVHEVNGRPLEDVLIESAVWPTFP